MALTRGQRITFKVLLLLLGMSVISAVSYFAVLFASFADEKFLMTLSFISGLVMLILYITAFFWKNRRMVFAYLFIIALIITVMLVGIRILYKTYYDKIQNITPAYAISQAQ